LVNAGLIRAVQKGFSMNVLVLCTGNSARSILLESILRHFSDGQISAYSAGSHPAGAVNPGALAQLKAIGLPLTGLRSKSWDEFATKGAPEMDLVITVCGNARDEACPVWIGAPVTAHWGADDPADVTEPAEAVHVAFSEAYTRLRKYADAFIALPFEDMSRIELQDAVRKIGELK
jgi:protein-tyrosine-phosphatase